MKKKIMGLAVASVLIANTVACLGANNPNPDVPDIDPISVESVKPAVEETPEVPAVEETTEPEIEKPATNETDTPEIAGDPKQETTGSKDDLKEVYQEYLDSMKVDGAYNISTRCGFVICGPSYDFVDINGDNVDDLIIWGALGLRSKSLCEVCLSNGDDFEAFAFEGMPLGYDGNVVYFSDDDYAEAGALRYTHEYMTEFNTDNSFTNIVELNEAWRWYNPETEESYDDPVLEEWGYYIDEEYSTEEDTMAMLENFKEKMTPVNYNTLLEN